VNDEIATKLTNAIVHQSATSEQVSAELEKLRGVLAGSPNVLERITAGRPRHALAALLVVVSLSALIGSAVALAWAP
jgi:hypothetical protein